MLHTCTPLSKKYKVIFKTLGKKFYIRCTIKKKHIVSQYRAVISNSSRLPTCMQIALCDNV